METEYAWCAGFFDGEGSTYVRQGNRARDYPELTLSVTQADEETLARFYDAMQQHGSVTGPVNESGIGKRPRYNYRTLRTEDTLWVLAMMWPYLGGIKRKQARDAIAKYEAAVPFYYKRESKVEEKQSLLREFRERTEA